MGASSPPLGQSLLHVFGLEPLLLTEADGRELDGHIAVLLSRATRFLLWRAVVMILLWWPTDLLVFRGLPHVLPVFVGLRAILLGASLIVLLYLRGRDALTARDQVLCVAPWIVACGLVSALLGTLGGLEQPWFHFTYLFLCIPLFFPVRPRTRILSSALVALALLLGYGLGAPGTLRSPYLPATLGFLIFVVGSSIIFGQIFFLLTQRNFIQARALRRSADDLAGQSARLAEQVAERTRELRLLAAHLELAREDERARISRELHDELGQELAALRYELRFTRQRFERDPASIRGNLETLEELLGRTALTTRELVTELRPHLLNDAGLTAALQWLVGRTEERAGLPCTLAIDGTEPPDLDRDLATHAFRITQEALTNVVRHASATRAAVRLCFAEDAITIEVRDDGVGIGAPGARAIGMGLIGMRERAAALGGALHIEGTAGQGTRIRCVLPLLPGRGAP